VQIQVPFVKETIIYISKYQRYPNIKETCPWVQSICRGEFLEIKLKNAFYPIAKMHRLSSIQNRLHDRINRRQPKSVPSGNLSWSLWKMVVVIVQKEGDHRASPVSGKFSQQNSAKECLQYRQSSNCYTPPVLKQ